MVGNPLTVAHERICRIRAKEDERVSFVEYFIYKDYLLSGVKFEEE